MSTYPYTNGAGTADLDVTTPVGNSDPVSDLSPAIQQIKKFLKDPAYAWLFSSNGKSGQFSTYSSGTQSVPTLASGATGTTMTLFNNKYFDLDTCFNTGTGLFTAQIKGIYDFSAFCQFDNSGSTAASMQIILRLIKNGSIVGGGSFNNVPSPPDDRWFVSITAKMQLNIGDTVNVQCNNTDGVGTGNLTASNAGFFGNLSFTTP